MTPSHHDNNPMAQPSRRTHAAHGIRTTKWYVRGLLVGLVVTVLLQSMHWVEFFRGAGTGGWLSPPSTDPPNEASDYNDRERTLEQHSHADAAPVVHSSRINNDTQSILPVWETHQDNHTTHYPYYLWGKIQYQFYPRHSNERTERRKALYLIQQETIPKWLGSSTRNGYDRDDHTSVQRTLDRYERSGQPIDSRTQSANGRARVDTWVLPHPLRYATRNHDTILLESSSSAKAHTQEQTNTNGHASVRAVTLLGRHSRHVQWMDLRTGEQGARRTTHSKDPDGRPLDDLNHVSAVLVSSLRRGSKNDNDDNEASEIWLPCGFHNDTVNSEVSATYARIVTVHNNDDDNSYSVRTGPKLPVAGGACVATRWTVVPDEPPMICTFGGTQGTHDRGTFLSDTACYDRIRQQWWSPFGRLPYGIDHGSLAEIPAGTCHRDDPARIMILNFRTRPYGDAHSEILAFDVPHEGWAVTDLEPAPLDHKNRETSPWYVYYNYTEPLKGSPETKDVGRDASGIIVVGGRHIVNFGGTYHYYESASDSHHKKPKRVRGRFSMIRSFDVCRKEWTVIGDLGLQTFALQTAASQDLQIALTCGGEAPMKNSNNHWCFVNRFHDGTVLTNRYQEPMGFSGVGFVD